jgi:hypothetical protein
VYSHQIFFIYHRFVLNIPELSIFFFGKTIMLVYLFIVSLINYNNFGGPTLQSLSNLNIVDLE